jgi:hypothetical protein
MTDSLKLKDLLSAMYLDVITGDVHVRNQYMNTFLTHVSIYLRMSKLEPRQPAIEKFRTRLHNTVSTILHNNHPLPAANTDREQEIQKLMEYFDRFVIKVDGKVADNVGLEQIGIIEDIETLEYARNICYSASEDYSAAMSGNPAGLTGASNKFAYIINIVTPILYRYEMAELSKAEYTKGVMAAALKRTEKRGEIQL